MENEKSLIDETVKNWDYSLSILKYLKDNHYFSSIMKMSLILMSLLLFVSCSSKVITYTNPKAKFSNFSSYQIVNAKIGKRQLPPDATELLGIVESQIKMEMEEKRNYEISNISPDLILRYELVSNTRTESNNDNSIYSVYSSANTRIIYQSVILLELMNNNKLIWQGSYNLNQSKREKKNETAVEKAISLIFTTYPYKAGSGSPDTSLTIKNKK
jgi:hypothetical protein